MKIMEPSKVGWEKFDPVGQHLFCVLNRGGEKEFLPESCVKLVGLINLFFYC